MSEGIITLSLLYKNNYIDFVQDVEQQRYIECVKDILNEKYCDNIPKAYVWTYGCQQNVSDSERIKGMLIDMGYEMTDILDEADFILYNTCAVREHAEDRVFGNVGALKNIKRRKPSVLIALCGCMMQQEHIAERIRKSYPHVGLVFGTHAIGHFPELMYNALTGSKRVFDINDKTEKIVENIPRSRDGKFKAWVSIMYGCDNFCSYCIVPYVRGRERSRKPDNIINEVKQLINNGYKEITLLGQNVNSYGKGLDEDINFAGLLQRICDIQGNFKIRFMTSHPKDATHELLDTMARNDKICKHLHLPFQSGNNRILKQMNRKYTREQYLELIEYARKVMPAISLTSDIIVGFPGETYEEFLDTVDLIKTVEFTSLFTFIYSKRKGTPAAEMDDPIPEKEKANWLNELLKVQEGIANKRTSAMENKIYEVLVEGYGKDGRLSGRTEGNVIIEFMGDNNLIGQYVNVKVTTTRNWIAFGELVNL